MLAAPRGIMDSLRAFLVPFHPTNLIMVGIFGVLGSFCLMAGFVGTLVALFMQVWVLKYCYVLIERIADGAQEPPVMDIDMLSPFEQRPLIQAAWLFGGYALAINVGGTWGLVIGVALLALLPATVSILGFGEAAWRILDPTAWFRVIRGLGPYYVALLVALFLCIAIGRFAFLNLWSIFGVTIALWFEIAFFSLVGACIYLRRQQLGYEPSRSPERKAARAEFERVKLRARMVDDVFQLVRIGKHVDATAPLAKWLRDLEAENASKDSYYVAEQAIKWENTAALNPIGSTLIRHLMRFGRPDAALAVFEILRKRSPTFTMDSANDLRTLADYAEANGREALAQSMRLETPVFHPRP